MTTTPVTLINLAALTVALSLFLLAVLAVLLLWWEGRKAQRRVLLERCWRAEFEGKGVEDRRRNLED